MCFWYNGTIVQHFLHTPYNMYNVPFTIYIKLKQVPIYFFHQAKASTYFR